MSETFLRQSVVDALWQAGGPAAAEEDSVEAVFDVFRPYLSRIKSLEGGLNELRAAYGLAVSRLHELTDERDELLIQREELFRQQGQIVLDTVKAVTGGPVANLRVMYDASCARVHDLILERDELIRQRDDLGHELNELRARYDNATAGWSDTLDELNELRERGIG